jgi:hypothetical protein
MQSVNILLGKKNTIFYNNDNNNNNLFFWVTLQNGDVPADIKSSALRLFYINLKFHFCYINVKFYIANKMYS